jgi:hypothetical protein
LLPQIGGVGADDVYVAPIIVPEVFMQLVPEFNDMALLQRSLAGCP